MNSSGENISNQIEEKMKKMKQDLEEQLGGVSDKVYYSVRDAFSEVRNQIEPIARAIETNTQQKIESQEKIQEVIDNVMMQYKDKLEQLTSEITEAVISELKKKQII
ncbi:MAG: hypothetical protein K5785_03425 [Nitrosarchaeum sp.]|nr:hypothetical protein [Nitrosarchaeum sp.]